MPAARQASTSAATAVAAAFAATTRPRENTGRISASWLNAPHGQSRDGFSVEYLPFPGLTFHAPQVFQKIPSEPRRDQREPPYREVRLLAQAPQPVEPAPALGRGRGRGPRGCRPA